MICAVFLASGRGKRFGADKLLYEVEGVPMAERAFRALPCQIPGVVVTGDAKVAALACAHANLTVVENRDARDDIAVTIRLGTLALPPEASGAMYFVCDQPHLTESSVARLAEAFRRAPENIYILSFAGRAGNPCVFPASVFGELASLPPDISGKAVAVRHRALVRYVEAEYAEELEDMDVRPDGASDKKENE